MATVRGDFVNFYIMTEPDLSENFWNLKYLTGIRAAVREYKGLLVEVDLQDLPKLRGEAAENPVRVPVILNGRSADWVASHVSHALKNGLHPILLAAENHTSQSGVSSLNFDFYGIYMAWCEYIHKNGWHNMALVGVNPDNMSDALKCRAFLDYNSKNDPGYNTGIYHMKGSLQECCEEFLAEAEKYDAVLCTNDVVSIVLMSLLRGRKSDHKMHVHSFWDSPLSEYLRPEVKMLSLDYHEMGRLAIRLCSFLAKNPGMEAVSATVRGITYPVGNVTENPRTVFEGNRLLKDKIAQDIYALERLFSALDGTDLVIVKGIVCGQSLDNIAEKAFISVGAVKYRIKKMLTLAEKSSRKELLALISEYLGTESFLFRNSD